MNTAASSHANEQKKLKLSLAIVLALMVWGLVFNELTESNIVALDAGSYVVSGLIGIITIYVSKLQDRPSNKVHPLGYSGFVPILNLIRSFMIILICLKGISESIGSIASGPEEAEHGIVFLYAGVTLLFNCIAFFYINRSAKQMQSQILKIDAVEWRIDIFYNVCVLVSFAISYGIKYLGYVNLANHIDPIFCILLSVGMAVTPIRMFSDNVKKLTVTSVDEVTQKEIVSRFHHQIPHFAAFAPYFTTIEMSGILWVEVQLRLAKGETVHAALKEWEQIGKVVLDDIHPNHHLTFRVR